MKIDCAYILYIDDPNSISYMEECARSCEQYDIPWHAIKWYKPPVKTSDLLVNHDLKLNPRLDHPDNIIHLKEAMCSTGHINIWKRIADYHTGAVAVFEHDAIVKGDIKQVEVEDNELVYLGYRFDNKDDYNCISSTFTKHKVNMFSGTHAYAITPNTAKHLVKTIQNKNLFTNYCEKCVCDKEYLPICSVDWWLGHNMLGLDNLLVVDPCPVIAAVGGKKSYTQYFEQVAKFNVIPSDISNLKFLEGITDRNKYFIDDKNFLRFR